MNDEHAHPEANATDDPLAKVAGAMKTAADAVKSGASDASTAAGNLIPAAGRAASKTVYATCYYLSYGIVFPTMLVVGVFPKNNPIYHGLVDGGHAAQDSVQGMRQRRAALKAARQEMGNAATMPAAAPA